MDGGCPLVFVGFLFYREIGSIGRFFVLVFLSFFPFFPPSFLLVKLCGVRGEGPVGGGDGGGGKDMWLIKLFFWYKFLEPLEVGSWHPRETLTRLMLGSAT